ncbi:sensor domain-containing protein [Mycobacterium hubeiense]|uniref:sensor domain-containing protein n=1 Tax=Mycobacterium hubeiense TaxID=1867256 RepID=UPI00115C2E9A|nr:sensor domain-containing protein [Mycobacterium sp. QGD 101]
MRAVTGMPLRPTAGLRDNRTVLLVRSRAAALVLLVLACTVASCTTTVEGTARYAGTKPSDGKPLVKNSQLPELLPSAAEMGKVMKVPGLLVALKYRKLESVPEDAISDPHCMGAVFGTVESVYRGSGYEGVYGHRLLDPAALTAGRMDAGVVTFGSAEEAHAFVAKQKDAWRECAGKPLTLKVSNQQVNWNATPPKVSNGVNVLSRTQEGAGGFGCARGLAASSNVVADVVACSDNSHSVADHASAIVNLILDRVTS